MGTREDLVEAVHRKVRRPLFATLCGPHLKGWSGPDTPFHVTGAMLLPLREVVGLRPATETKERRVTSGGHEVVLTFHDLRRYLDGMARASNTALLEDLHSPHVILEGPVHVRLLALARTLLTRTSYHDFRDRCVAARERLVAATSPAVADLLEAARVTLAGTTALATGMISSNLEELIDQHDVLWLRPFLLRQRQEGEGARLASDEVRLLTRELSRLEGGLADARDHSVLPDGLGSVSGLDELLVELRLADLNPDAPQ